MKQMKKLFAFILVLCVVFGLCACGGNTDSDADVKDDNVVNSQTENKESEDAAEDEAEDETKEESTATFNVKVVDGDGNPVAGVMVQVCKDTCLPAVTGDDGVAVFNLEVEDGHKLSVASCPEGYEYTGEQEIYLESGITEYTVEISGVN